MITSPQSSLITSPIVLLNSHPGLHIIAWLVANHSCFAIITTVYARKDSIMHKKILHNCYQWDRGKILFRQEVLAIVTGLFTPAMPSINLPHFSGTNRVLATAILFRMPIALPLRS